MTRFLRIATASLAAVVLMCGAARAQSSPDAASEQTAPVQNSIKLVRVIAALPAGAPWLTLSTPSLSGGLLSLVLCFHDGVTRTWDGGRQDQDLPPYAAAFKSEVDRGGYKVVTPGEDNLFGQQSGATDLQVAAVITDMQIDGCLSHGGEIRGSGTMKVDWQIYSPIKKQVVARASTSANTKLENSEAGGVQRLVSGTFAANTRELVSSADFRTAMSAPKALTKGFVMPGQQSKIVLAGSLNIPKRQIADATGSVVTILTGSGSGSGFLVSTDGYLLTDAHVLGDEKNVRIRWPDGLETLATVERVSEKRDVAILKTNPRDRAPLALRRGPVTPGQRVYAIGSPGGRKFESTVSSGVISSDRVFGGLRYIQSDTTVSHGSSGGPLLDENGAVIGLTDLGLPNAGPTGEEGPAGLNLFTPIGDAMDFLALEQK
jgi:serine protease Do